MQVLVGVLGGGVRMEVALKREGKLSDIMLVESVKLMRLNLKNGRGNYAYLNSGKKVYIVDDKRNGFSL